jgi:predicted permease
MKMKDKALLSAFTALVAAFAITSQQAGKHIVFTVAASFIVWAVAISTKRLNRPSQRIAVIFALAGAYAQTPFLPLAAIALWFVSPQVSDRIIRKAVGVE